MQNDLPWVKVTQPPKENGQYLVYIATINNAKPLYQVAWYDLGKGDYPKGWTIYPDVFRTSVTHYLVLKKPK